MESKFLSPEDSGAMQTVIDSYESLIAMVRDQDRKKPLKARPFLGFGRARPCPAVRAFVAAIDPNAGSTRRSVSPLAGQRA